MVEMIFKGKMNAETYVHFAVKYTNIKHKDLAQELKVQVGASSYRILKKAQKGMND